MSTLFTKVAKHDSAHNIAMTINQSATLGFALPALSTYLTLAAANALAEFMGLGPTQHRSANDKATNTGVATKPRQAAPRNALLTLAD